MSFVRIIPEDFRLSGQAPFRTVICIDATIECTQSPRGEVSDFYTSFIIALTTAACVRWSQSHGSSTGLHIALYRHSPKIQCIASPSLLMRSLWIGERLVLPLPIRKLVLKISDLTGGIARHRRVPQDSRCCPSGSRRISLGIQIAGID